jgi:RNA polymerase sigma-70 factor (ECF subfamily)
MKMNPITTLANTRKLKRSIAEHRDSLYRVAYSWCHNPALADDLVQEAMAKALKNSGQLRDTQTIKSWLYRILTNCWHDHFRRTREMTNIDDLVLVDTETPEFQHTRQQIVNQVRKAISRLPMGQRQALTLVDLEGCSYIEVAQILDIPIGTVMSRLSRARATLKAKLLEADLAPEGTVSRLRTVK